MYLKKLSLAGFKSFADPTEFQFHPGTTAVVGPNGCGKSNVVDAFRWVLGERSAKELRGQEMLDVIFKGTTARPPVGRAEVALLFDNSDGTLDIACAEVEVTRRLYRSGESEYLLNNRRCRLKDVRALFADTGIGIEGYSILEQGAVDAFLHANPEERRAIFEEAAGISRFKKQTAQSLRQLERVEANLARLADIHREVERQVRSVKIQAGKARRFLEDRDALLQLRSVLAAEEIARQRIERESLTFDLEHLSVRQELIRELIARLAHDDAAVRRSTEQASQGLAVIREEEMRRRMDLDRIVQRRRHIAENRAEMQAAAMRRTEQLRDLSQVEEEYGTRRVEVRVGLRGELAALRAVRAEFDDQDHVRRQLSDEKARVDRMIRTLREEALSLLVSETRENNERTTLEAEDRGLAARAARRKVEGEGFLREVAAAEAALDEIGALRLAAEVAAKDAGRAAKLLQEEIARRAQLQGETERTLEDLRARCHDQEARLRSLEELEKAREGVSRGARKLLAAEHPLRRDVLGLLADSIDVTPEVAAMIDAVLGSFSDTVVVSGGAPLSDQVRVLSQVLDGEGVTFCQTIPATSPASSAAGPHKAREPAPIGEPLVDLIACEPLLRPLLERVFGNVRVVEDLASALGAEAAARQNGFRLVTREGALVEPWGAVTIPGSAGRVGLVSRQSEIKKLRVDLAARKLDLARVTEQASTLQSDIDVRHEELRHATAKGQRSNLEEENLARRAAEVARDRERAAERFRVVEGEIAELADAQSRVERDRIRLDARLAEIAGERRRLETEIATREELLSEQEERLHELETRLSQLRVLATQKEERILSLRREELRIVGEISERRERRRWLEEEDGRDIEREHAFSGEERELDSDAASIDRSLAALASNAVRVEGDVTARREQLAELERITALARSEEEALREAREGALVRENECRVLIGAVREKVAAEFQTDLAQHPVAQWRKSMASEGEDTGAFVSRLSALAEETQERLRKNSNVNLEAVKELEDLENRESHLRAQIEDVEVSKQKLIEAITSLNTTSRELFATTFAAIRHNFQELFAKVFSGGEADLRLEEDRDILEAGVDVIARPPGKRITSLKLLSGGEKALTAVAVLFALFRHKPSPFCILDEVDAPLDESNTRRFVRMLKEFTASTQFLVITHSKVTMAEAERLYGVTMEERGVSRQIAVRLEEAAAASDAKPDAVENGEAPESVGHSDDDPILSRMAPVDDAIGASRLAEAGAHGG